MPQWLRHNALSHPKLYDLVQWAVGAAKVRARLVPLLAGSEERIVLDIGAGTGGLRALLPENCCYIWMDNDPQKLRGYTVRPGDRAILGSALCLALAPNSVDQALCASVAHHLGDAELRQALREIARVIRYKLVFLDPVDCPARPVSRLLWSIDRGSFPRSPEVLRRFLEEYYVLERAEVFTVLHRYFACVARPRATTVCHVD
jgi:ubiquinone/menaquinone biosynthesis C-methylase UbiE